MIITLGLDLSLTGTGLVIVGDGKIIKQKLIKSKPIGPSSLDELLRLRSIVDRIESEICLFTFQEAFIEGLAFSVNKTTSVMQLGALNYFVRDLLARYGIHFVIVAPSTLKKFVSGRGHTKKDGMMLETYKRWGESFDDDNLCDAFGLSMIGQELYNKKREDLPIFQQEVIKVLSGQLNSKT